PFLADQSVVERRSPSRENSNGVGDSAGGGPPSHSADWDTGMFRTGKGQDGHFRSSPASTRNSNYRARSASTYFARNHGTDPQTPVWRVRVWFKRVLGAFTECFRQGDCQRQLPSVQGALAEMDQAVKQIRDSRILSNQKLEIPLQM